MKKITLFLLILSLTACATPELIEERVNDKYSVCFINGDTIEEIKECLPSSVAEDLRQYGDSYLYKTCRPYWGYPLVSSCAGFELSFNNSMTLESWKTWKYYDESLKL